MALTEFTGPLLVPGDGFTSNNQDQAPSLVWGGVGLVDPRFLYTPGAAGTSIYGFAPGNEALVVDQVPSQLSNVNIAAAHTTVSGTAMTLVSTSGAGITVTTSATKIPQTGKTVPSGALAIDLVPGVVQFGTTKKIAVADPTKNIARAVSITAPNTAAGGAFLVNGYDLYGYPQTESITAVTNSTVNGKKGFKFITSVVPQFTDATYAYSVGTADVYEFPLRVDSFPYATVGWNGAIVAASTGFVKAVTTAASSTTGSVRGTYAVQSASDGTKSLQMFISVSPANITSQTGMFGVTPA
jgi:hypothetical protein